MDNSEKEKAMTQKKDPSQHSDDVPRTSGANRSGENGKPVSNGSSSSDTLSPANSGGEKTKNKKESNGNRDDNKKNGSKSKGNDRGAKTIRNNLREIRIEQMMSKAELARKAGLSVLTIDRIEKGFGCRMDTKRKILKALGLKLSDRRKVFKED